MRSSRVRRDAVRWAMLFPVAMLLLVLCAATASAQTGSGPGVFVSVGGGQQSSTPSFSETFKTSLYVEEAEYESRYGAKSGSAIDLGGGVRVWQRVWLGASFASSTHRHAAEVSGRLPHPFRFSDFRSIAGSTGGLRHDEKGIHVQALWRHVLTPRLTVTGFAGPSWLSVKRDLVEALEYEETYPYDAAAFTGSKVARQSGSAVGFGVGVDVTFNLWNRLGVGAQIRHTKANIDLDVASGRTVRVKAGGTQSSAGVRVAF